MDKSKCPICKMGGESVDYITVQSITQGKAMRGDYLICFNPNCEIVYFDNSIESVYKISDIETQIWFKNSSDEDCPICYCANLTRREIKEAVSKGYKTISEIRKFTGKTTTGQCLRKNPIGKCCHKDFAIEIKNI